MYALFIGFIVSPCRNALLDVWRQTRFPGFRNPLEFELAAVGPALRKPDLGRHVGIGGRVRSVDPAGEVVHVVLHAFIRHETHVGGE